LISQHPPELEVLSQLLEPTEQPITGSFSVCLDTRIGKEQNSAYSYPTLAGKQPKDKLKNIQFKEDAVVCLHATHIPHGHGPLHKRPPQQGRLINSLLLLRG
jgi:hypothetical protein